MRRVVFSVIILMMLTSCNKHIIDSLSLNTPTPEISIADTTSYFEKCLFRPGDYGSANWRIPAIMCISDGSLLITCDKRKYNEGDLPQDIDIVSCRSIDGGRTWSEPVTIAKGTGIKKGYGDAAIVQCANGDIICVFVGGNGLFSSSESDPIRSYVCRSNDGGRSWGPAEDITTQLWGSQATNPTCRNYKASFFGSGNGLRLTRGAHSGRIMFAAAMCRKNSNTLDNFVVYSDDNGTTWHVSDIAYSGGDEAKLVELVDGRILISVRQNGTRGYNFSNDDGQSWGTQGQWSELSTNACNGDLARLAAKDHGDNSNILVHSIPNSTHRENVSLFFSYDEGVTWQNPILLFDGPSVYSSVTVLPNRGLGVFMEQNPNGACELWYRYIPPRELPKR